MTTDLDDTKVFADELQARGDPRGELLSLEIAAEYAPTSAEARRFNREAQRIRDAHFALVWPESLRNTKVGIRAGFVIDANCNDLFASHVPSELALSARSLRSYERLEDLLPKLIDARARGLALDRFLHSRLDRTPTSVAGLRALAAKHGRWPAVRHLDLSARLEDLDAVACLAGLESLGIDRPLARGQLRSLAGLELKELRIRTQEIDALVELFGPTLESLWLFERPDSLASLRELPRLRSLYLSNEPSTAELANLARLPALAELHLPSLDPNSIEALRTLRLRRLSVNSLPAELLPAFAGLTNVDELDYSEIVVDEDLEIFGERIDLTPLLARPNLRELEITENSQSELVLPETVEQLIIKRVDRPLAIVGAPTIVDVVNCDLGCLPPALLLGVRHLGVDWSEIARPDCLAKLAQACPNLETFHLWGWHWKEAPRILAALPQLRACSLGAGSMGAIAELARQFPDLNMNAGGRFPRTGLPPAD